MHRTLVHLEATYTKRTVENDKGEFADKVYLSLGSPLFLFLSFRFYQLT